MDNDGDNMNITITPLPWLNRKIEQYRFAYQGSSIFTVHVSDIEPDTGRINQIRVVGECKNRPNSIIETWDAKGWEKAGHHPISFVGEDGVKKLSVIVSEAGTTTDLFTTPRKYKNLEEIIGKAATLDDIPEALDLHKSLKWIGIGFVAGMPVGYMVFTVLMLIFQAMAK